MMNITISSAVSIELFNRMQNAARERHMTVSALVRTALANLLDGDDVKARTEEDECKMRPERKTVL